MEGQMGNPADDASLFVKFYKKAVEMKAESEVKGHPVFKEIDYISIIVAGDPTNQIDRKVRAEDKLRFAPIWTRYEAGAEEGVEGMPIDEWSAIPLAQKAMLKQMEFRTVESLAAASDTVLQRIGMGGIELRDKAKAFLEAAGDSAAIMKYAAENKRLSGQIDDLTAQVAELAAKLSTPKRKKAV